ncbi:amino acid adenylation domain-containing protein [Streptomyces sp. NPDC051954]|uniref:non-ribosomal peptide synthetase n=1 Tax=Streptomyces sp. NPDC051954 TaxID=3155524 RepID=UPI00341390FE
MSKAPTHAAEDLLRAQEGLSPERRALLAKRLAAGRRSARPPLRALPRTGGTQRFVAAPGQQQLYYQHELDPAAVNYLLPIAVRLHGDLRPDALAAALASVVARHEALRTGFEIDHERGGVVQVVAAAGEVGVELETGRARADEIDALLRTITRRPFDLSAPPLLRATLWQLDENAGGPAVAEPVSPAEHGGEPEPGAGGVAAGASAAGSAGSGAVKAGVAGADIAAGAAAGAGSAGGSWLLTLCVHHIVVDGWSLGVLVDELAESYAAAVQGRDARLPELTLNYPDFADSQHEWLAGEEAAGRIAHWRERLAGVPVFEPAGDRPRPARPTFDGAAVRIDLDADLVEGITRLGRSEQATPFMVLLAAYAAVLHRWSAEPDLVIGTAVAGRSRPEWEPLIGFFVNTVPLRVDVDSEATFRDLLRVARHSALDGFAHQDVPYPRIVQEAGGERHSGRSALVRALLALRNVPMRRLELPGVRTETLNLPKTGSDLDLSLEFSPAEEGDGLTGWLSYSSDLFDRDTAERIGTAVRQVVAAAVATDGAATVGELPYMTELERRRLVAEFSGRDRTAPAAGGLLDVFDAAVATAPDATAAVADTASADPSLTLTYRELDERANQLAHLLLQRGVGADDRVAVCLPRSLDLLVAVLGVLKAGAVLLPLESEHPAERLAELIADAAPHTVLTDADLAARLPAGPAVLTEWDRAAAGDGFPAHRPDTAELPDAGAYVLYTSGSTGRPKGVVVTRAGLANRLAGMRTEFALGADDVVLHKTALSADTAMWELLVALTCGGTVVLSAPGRHADVSYLHDVLARKQVTTCFFVPSVLRPALDQGGFAEAAATLRLVISAGEELPAALADQFRAAAPHVRLVNSYGPTESTINITEHTVTTPAVEPVPIGRPVPGVDTYVLDEHGRLQPIGIPGELHAGGVQVARGYLGRPGQTAERYVPHPFAPGARLYRTGDRARWRPDGTLEFLGRTDHQVKIRGFRVEPGEVEAVLRAQPSVADAVVVARHSPVGGLRLIGYVTGPAGQPAPEAATLRARLHNLLPSPMVPDVFVPLEAFPVTAYGKIDRARLPEPGRRPAAVVHTPPAGPLQQVLAGIWEETLGVTGLGVDNDFFACGGHSVLATLVVSRIRDLFRLDLPLHFFVEAPTIAGLATMMRAEGAEAGIDVDRVAALVQQVQRMSQDELAEKLEG